MTFSLARQLAHELRSPLSALVVLTDSLQTDLEGVAGERDLNRLRLLASCAWSLNTILDDVVELDGAAGLKTLPPGAAFSVSELLGSVQDLLLPMAEVRGVQIEVDSGATDKRIGHPSALRPVLVSLGTASLRTRGPTFLAISAVPLSEDIRRVQFTVRHDGPDFHPTPVLELPRRLIQMMGSTLHVAGAGDPESGFQFVLDLLPAAEAPPGP